MIDIARIQQYLDDSAAAAQWLRSMKLTNVARAHGNLLRIATSGLTLDLMAVVAEQLDASLKTCADPDMAMNHLERFVGGARSPLAIGALFERDPLALPTLIQIFSTSDHLSELLIADPESFELLRETGGRPVAAEHLRDLIVGEVEALEHDAMVVRALRRFKRREMLRIAYGDIIHQQSLRTVTQQISFLADASIEAALRAAWRKTVERRGTPRGYEGRPARFVVLALGKLGGDELNYSSDIDLIFLYDHEGMTDHRRPRSNAEFFAQMSRELVRYLTESTEFGSAWRVDLRLRPNGDQGPIALGHDAAIQYYENRGRTWERQAFIKARACAGDLALGHQLLDQLTPWIYRRYLSQADISGIKALKRRIERRVIHEGDDHRNVKTGRGGIRDIEFVIQFLQLLNGGDLPEIRTGNTLEAIARLEAVGCLSHQESDFLQENYTFLRRAEHLLQIMHDVQTHVLPREPDEVRKLALRLGYGPRGGRSAYERFEADYADKTALNRRILDHLLHDAFGEDGQTAAEVDLVLDPDPPAERVGEVLGRYGFHDARAAYKNLMTLGEEKIRFLSTRRCRHFLASIAPEMLPMIAASPDPDSTLVHLGQVSDSLGGKGVLWELFSFNRPSMELYVRLCAYAPYLCGILTSNPGMIDSLMDSLVLNKLPTAETLRQILTDLSRGAVDTEPILHSFKNDQQLRVGVRDILGKSDIRRTTGALADIAQVCLEQIVHEEYHALIGKLGMPLVAEGAEQGRPAELAIVGMGKLGGRELNYHSDLDLIFLYEADGSTRHAGFAAHRQTTTNQHFFGELGQRIIKRLGHLGAHGRLYEVDARLRPTGKTGPLATSLDALLEYFRGGGGALWERQALCRARVVCASPRMARMTKSTLDRAIYENRWRKTFATEIRDMRARLEATTSGRRDFKRGAGGMVDIEFLTQMLQLRYGRRSPKIRCPNTLAALELLHEAGHLDPADFDFLQRAYRFLRTIESYLKLMNQPVTSVLPDDPTVLAKLAHLMNAPSPNALTARFHETLDETRRRFERHFDTGGVS